MARNLISRGCQEFLQERWVLGTNGNFSAVISMDPLRLAITAPGLDTGGLSTYILSRLMAKPMLCAEIAAAHKVGMQVILCNRDERISELPESKPVIHSFGEIFPD